MKDQRSNVKINFLCSSFRIYRCQFIYSYKWKCKEEK